MKKWLFALGCLALFAGSAIAAETKFSKITVDVAEGWTSSEKNSEVLMVAPDKKASLAITFDKSNGLTGEALAAAISKAQGGTKPELEDGIYLFTSTKNGETVLSFLMEGNGYYALYTVTDPAEKYGEAINGMVESAAPNEALLSK